MPTNTPNLGLIKPLDGENYDVEVTRDNADLLDADSVVNETHRDGTTSVHGIADTADLETVAGAAAQITTHSADTTAVHGIADTSVLETTSGSAAKVAAHEADTTSVHGIADTGNLILEGDTRLSDDRDPTAHATSHATAGADPITPGDIGAASTSHTHTAYATAEDEGTPVTQRGTVNFTGAGVSVADTGGKTVVTIPGGDGGDVAAHEADTTGIHGITDTAALETTTGSADKVETHRADATDVHGIADTGDLILEGDTRLTDARTPTAHAASHLTGGSDPLTITAYATVKDEATPVTQRSTISFAGAGVNVADTGGETVVTIPAGGDMQIAKYAVSAADYSSTAEQLLESADTLTGWTAVNFQTALSTDTTNKTQGTGSASCVLNTGTANNASLTAKVYVDLAAGQAVSTYQYVAVDWRWDDAGPGLGGAPEDVFALKIGSSTALGGTTNQIAVPGTPEGTFGTIMCPVGALTSVRSIGIITVAAPGTTTNRATVKVDNVRYLASTKLDAALAAAASQGVVVPADHSEAQTQSRVTLASTDSFLDLRGGQEHLTRVGGQRWTRDWKLREDGAADVSADLGAIFGELVEGDTLNFTPGADYMVDHPVVMNASGVTINQNGARFFASSAHEYTNGMILLKNCERVIWNDLNQFGYRKVSFNGSTFTTIAGTPTTSGSTKLIDAQDEEARTPLDSNGETAFYARNKDGNNVWELTLSDSAQVANDCVIQVKNEAGTVRQTTTLTLTGTPALTTVNYQPVALDEKLYLTVKKSTATANTITVTSGAAYGSVLYSGTLEFNSGVILSDCYNITFNRYAGEGFGGDAIQSSNANVKHITVNGLFSRAMSRQGVSFNRGTDFEMNEYQIFCPHRSGVDIEPFDSSWSVNKVTLRNGTISGARNWGLGMTHWAQIFDVTVENLAIHTGGLGFMSGGCTGGSFRNVTVDSIWTGGEYDAVVNGRDMRFNNIALSKGIAVTTTQSEGLDPGGIHGYDVSIKGGNYSHVKVTAANSFMQCVSAETYSDTLTTVTYVGAFEIPTADYALLDAGAHRAMWPNTYKGLATKPLWYPQGLNLLAEPAFNVRALSGSATRKGNNLSGLAVAVGAADTSKAVTFPVKAYPSFGSTPTVAATTGGSLAAATYFYKFAARPLYGGPRLAMTTERSVAVGGSNNAVNITVSGWNIDTDCVISGLTVYRGTSTGTYTERYDLLPNAPFYGVRADGEVLKDVGTTLNFTAVTQKTWGYPATTATSSGEALVPADETGFEPDVNYSVVVVPHWDTRWWVSGSVTRGGFTIGFSTAPGGAGSTFDWFLVS